MTPICHDPIRLGQVTIDIPVFLAPMAGITDLPFRRAVARFGAGLVVSEMVASSEMVTTRPSPRASVRAKALTEGATPVSVQIAGREPAPMAETARIVAGMGARIIDINMGCPAKKVTGGLSGAALMRDLDHALSLIDAVVGAVDLPVTLKMRLGWDDACLNAADLSARARDAGVRMLTVHGRTRAQFYKGRADWAAIRGVANLPGRPPLVANGDIVDADSALAALAQSGADAVMMAWRAGRTLEAGRDRPCPARHPRTRDPARRGAGRSGGGPLRGHDRILRDRSGAARRAQASWLVCRCQWRGGRQARAVSRRKRRRNAAADPRHLRRQSRTAGKSRRMTILPGFILGPSFDALPLPGLMLDGEGRLVGLNDAAEQWLNLSRRLALGHRLAEELIEARLRITPALDPLVARVRATQARSVSRECASIWRPIGRHAPRFGDVHYGPAPRRSRAVSRC